MTALASGRAIQPKLPRYRQPGQLAKWYRCLRKLPYTHENAELEVTRRNSLLDFNERTWNSYVCRDCGQYHVGHIPKRTSVNRHNPTRGYYFEEESH